MPTSNPYAATCPTRLVLDRVADKWAVLVLGLLGEGPVRFNQLRRTIEGLSQKMLSQTLKNLERDGLVHRKAIPTVPVTVEYSITPLGQTLSATVDALRVWAESHIEDVLAAQARYDAGSSTVAN
ncbi:winged helix-turn-helix transcriptional regulator [Methylobacterium sp. J-067]|uniref:winged helix-turn-helix transcriptional regulator n=1 Tax=Methylobacterium sp. J-067 TaxID=2836648 RepID=UPI001FBA97C1|nr:helix-turn-helix domain-containing protein [Methylobacterium sp. J-067]MCJ2023846.1 helix-turn-helix transcriptional regulator [Methylobacterium sp. J-067]